MQKIVYVYGSNQSEEKVLLGFEVYSINENLKRRGYYLGDIISLENVSDMEVKSLLKTDDVSNIINRANQVNAQGLIYFPTARTYGFLEPTDTVVETLEELLTLADEIKKETPKEFLPSEKLDPDNSLLELRNLTLIRQKTSDR